MTRQSHVLCRSCLLRGCFIRTPNFSVLSGKSPFHVFSLITDFQTAEQFREGVLSLSLHFLPPFRDDSALLLSALFLFSLQRHPPCPQPQAFYALVLIALLL